MFVKYYTFSSQQRFSPLFATRTQSGKRCVHSVWLLFFLQNEHQDTKNLIVHFTKTLNSDTAQDRLNFLLSTLYSTSQPSLQSYKMNYVVHVCVLNKEKTPLKCVF